MHGHVPIPSQVTPMRIGLLAPPWIPVPPPSYGGTESVVALLARGLARAGHEVVLAAPPGSAVPGVRTLTYLDSLPTRIGHSWDECRHVLPAAADLRDCDVVMDHSGLLGAFVLAHAGPPALHVVHGPLGPSERRTYEALLCHADTLGLVAISDAQRRMAPDLPFAGVCHNAIDPEDVPFSAEPGDHLVFLGRLSPDKGVLEAVEIAARLGMPLLIAAKCREPEERDYLERCVAPRLGDRARYLGEVDTAQKFALLRGARALVFPIAWDEPFGMVMVEAMATGTPVLAIGRGAVPEVVEDGVTGFVRDDVDGLVAAGARLGDIDRRACRERVERAFSPVPFVARYERVLGARVRDGAGGRPAVVQARLPRRLEPVGVARTLADGRAAGAADDGMRVEARVLVTEVVANGVPHADGPEAAIAAHVRDGRPHGEVSGGACAAGPDRAGPAVQR